MLCKVQTVLALTKKTEGKPGNEKNLSKTSAGIIDYADCKVFLHFQLVCETQARLISISSIHTREGSKNSSPSLNFVQKDNYRRKNMPTLPIQPKCRAKVFRRWQIADKDREGNLVSPSLQVFIALCSALVGSEEATLNRNFFRVALC